MRDWVAWHSEYDDPNSSLSARLTVVRQQIRNALDAAPAGPIRLISACAGQGLDVVGALDGHPRRADVHGLLVEQDGGLSEASGHLLQDAGLPAIRAVQGDAGHTGAYAGAVPADLLLLCGIFGNISDDDIANTVSRASMLCGPAAAVIWTRHRRAPDLTPRIRRWWLAAGFDETAFVSPGPEEYAVGVCRLSAQPARYDADVLLFTFR